MTISGSFLEGKSTSLEDHFHLVVSHPSVLLAGLPFAACLLAILGAHEMGHYLTCRYYRIPATLPYFLPGPPPFGTFGAVIRIRGIIPDRRALFDVAAAGPLAGFLVAVPIVIAGILHAQPTPMATSEGALALGSPLLSRLLERWFFGEAPLTVGSIYFAGWFGLLVTSMNLFPVGQLDGGHVACSLSRRAHRILSRASILGLAAWILVEAGFFRRFPFYIVWWVILAVMRDRHPRLGDESAALGRGRRLMAVVLLLLFIVCLIPVPFYFD